MLCLDSVFGIDGLMVREFMVYPVFRFRIWYRWIGGAGIRLCGQWSHIGAFATSATRDRGYRYRLPSDGTGR